MRRGEEGEEGEEEKRGRQGREEGDGRDEGVRVEGGADTTIFLPEKYFKLV